MIHNKIFNYLLGALTICCSNNAIAAFTPGNISAYQQKFLLTSQQINISHYKHCQRLISKCPTTLGIQQNTCINKLGTTISCKQLQLLAAKLDTNLNLLQLQPAGKVLLIKQKFTADGQSAYYILDTAGTISDTNINPNVLNSFLHKQYPNTDYLATPAKAFSIQAFPQGSTSIMFPMQAKTCVACKTLFTYTLNFDFDKDGKYRAVQMHTYAPL